MTHENESAPAVAAAQGAQDDRSGDAITTQDIGAGAPAQLEFHPLADAFPLLEGKAFEELVDDIKAHGQRESIILHEGMILDGRNRYRACRELGIAPWTTAFESIAAPDDTPEAYVISVNAHRRHLTPEQKQAVLIKLRVANPEKSDRQLAAEAGVAHTTMSRATKQAEATGAIAPVKGRIGADGKKRKQPKKLTKAQKAEQAHRRRTRKAEIAKNREHAIMAQLPDDMYDLLDDAEEAGGEFREHTVDIWTTRAEEVVDHAKAETFARAAASVWTRLADGIRKKASPVGNDTDPAQSAEARKAEFAKAEDKPAPAAKKKRGRPPGSKNRREA